MKPRIVAKDKNHLEILISQEIEANGFQCDLNHIDVSNVETMEGMFLNSEFNGDITKLDVSKVKDMTGMFHGSKFTGDLSNWTPFELTNTMEMYDDWVPFEEPWAKKAKRAVVCKAPIPYWVKIVDKEERVALINNYLFTKEVESELPVNDDNKKPKAKI
jgi:hypothetical protein